MRFRNVIDWFIPDTIRAEPETYHRARIVVGASLILPLGAPLAIASFIQMKVPAIFSVIQGTTALIAMCCPLLIRYFGSVITAGSIFIAVLTVNMTVFLVFQGGLSSPGLIFFPCLSVIFTYILGKWAGIFWAIYSMLLVGALYWAESAGITLPTMGLPINPDLLRTVGTLAFVSFTLVFALYYEKTRVDSYRTIVEQQQALLQSSKMAALGEMAGGVAHEINNPLAIIQFNADFAKKALGSDPLQRERIVKSLEMIQGTSQRINSIIKGLMNFSKEGSEEELASVSVAQLIRDTLGLCSEKFKAHGIDLSVHEITDSITVQVRPSQISQVLLNLLSNAYDAISGCEGRWIRIESRAHGKTIQISVTDSGGGIATKDRERLFEPFFTTKPVGSGTGLGLSISQGLIESHGGRLFLDESSEHTRFTIELPLGQQL